MLVNLKELDLSFNYIERIENLEKLVNLEILSLFSNMITKLENLDTLQKLIILSVGNNLITSTEGVCSKLILNMLIRIFYKHNDPISENVFLLFSKLRFEQFPMILF